MESEKRRQKIIDILIKSDKPVSGTELSSIVHVSRQVIVQDIALLRAANKNILSTNKGYLLFCPTDSEHKYRRTIKVKHKTNQIREELYTILEYGGKVLDVVVEHEIYGQITVDLIICSKFDADDFIQKLETLKISPLKELTDNVHFHTIEADSKEILNLIEKKLKEFNIIHQ